LQSKTRLNQKIRTNLVKGKKKKKKQDGGGGGGEKLRGGGGGATEKDRKIALFTISVPWMKIQREARPPLPPGADVHESSHLKSLYFNFISLCMK